MNIENLVVELTKRETAVAQAVEALKAAQADLREFEENTIPSVFDEAGLASVKLADGRSLSVVEDVYASIKKEHKEAAYDWLRENHYDDIIKTKVTVDFGKGESCAALAETIIELGLVPSIAESIHPSTYKAFCRELVLGPSRVEVDRELLGIFLRRFAKIK